MTETKYPAKILAALNAIMGVCGYVEKKGKNTFHNYKYAGEANILEVLRPAMVANGLILIPSHAGKSEIDQYGNMFVTVEYTLAHKDGDVWPEKIIAFGAGNDKNKTGNVGDKGLYKALTGANKYLLFKLFQIETGDDPERDADHDKASAPAAANEPVAKPNPGISKARTWLNETTRHMRSIQAPDELIEFLDGPDEDGVPVFDRAVKICRDYPEIWMGPEEGSGLRGQIQQVAAQLRVARESADWLERVQTKAKAQPAQKAA